MKKFKDLGISPDFIQSLTELNIVNPTEIQRKAIPLLLSKPIDLVAQAQTGTGKTAAYGLPLLMQMDAKAKHVQGLILCPTRELAKQVAKQLFKFTKYSNKVFTEAVYGGERIDKQIDSLRRPTHIVVATPGRLIDLIKRKAVDLRQVKTIVLDEADEMLSMGFKDELNAILDSLPMVKNKWLFSATIPDGIQQIIFKYLAKNAIKIVVEKNNIVNQKIKHEFMACNDDDDKLNALLSYLKSEDQNRGVIFCKTKAATKKLSQQLIAKNISTDAIHGDLQQKERDKVMRAFKNESLKVLVATDLAARGIDISDLAFVVHYQLPESEEYYTHRSGRTARAGKNGISIVFANSNDVRQLREYERSLGIKFKEI